MIMKKEVLLITTLSILGLGLGANYKSKHPNKYSYKWISNLTDAEWKAEREYIRKEIFCNPDLSTAIRENAHKLLDLFDKVWRDKHYTGEIGFPVHREHGWYINND